MNPGTTPFNWTIGIVCKDCKSVFIVETPNPSKEVLGGRSCVALISIPNECPECLNLKVVRGGESA